MPRPTNRVPVPVAYKVCGRCGAELHAPDPPHLCADLQARAKRQERYVKLVEQVVEREGFWMPREAYEEVVKALLNAGIEGER